MLGLIYIVVFLLLIMPEKEKKVSKEDLAELLKKKKGKEEKVSKEDLVELLKKKKIEIKAEEPEEKSVKEKVSVLPANFVESDVSSGLNHLQEVLFNLKKGSASLDAIAEAPAQFSVLERRTAGVWVDKDDKEDDLYGVKGYDEKEKREYDVKKATEEGRNYDSRIVSVERLKMEEVGRKIGIQHELGVAPVMRNEAGNIGRENRDSYVEPEKLDMANVGREDINKPKEYIPR